MLSNEFKKSSISMIYMNCVTCRQKDDTVQVSHSKHPEELISYSIPEWEAFIGGVKNGEFDV